MTTEQAISYTKEELKEFESLVDSVSSRDQLSRISARLDMHKFVEKHGKEKCDAMFAEIAKNDPK